jgi:hypothetical protein
MYIPKEWIFQSGNGPQVKSGFMPKDENFVKYKKSSPV